MPHPYTFLAINTSQSYLSISIERPNQPKLSYHAPAHRQQSQQVLAIIDELIVAAGLTRVEFGAQLDAILIGEGPGSFVGLRLGISVAQGLASAWQVPVIPISDTLLLAYQAYIDAQNNQHVQSAQSDAARQSDTTSTSRTMPSSASYFWVAIDARMNQVYTALFEMQFKDQVDHKPSAQSKTLKQPAMPSFVARLATQLLSPVNVEVVTNQLSSSLSTPDATLSLTAIGSGFAAYPELMNQLNELDISQSLSEFDDMQMQTPRAELMADLLLDVMQYDKQDIDSHQNQIALPNYVRNQVADKPKTR